MNWEKESEAAAKKAAAELLARFAPYPTELNGKAFDNMATGERMQHLQWQMKRDDLRRIFARALGCHPD